MRKSQSAMEFIVLASFMLVAALGFFAVMSSKILESREEGNKKIAEDISSIAYREIEMAKGFNNGYERYFIMPTTINGVAYTINLTANRELIVNYLGYEHVRFLPSNVSGNLSAGYNRIRKVDGVIGLTATSPPPPPSPPPTSTSFSFSVSQSSDDAEESISTIVSRTSSDLELVHDTSDQTIGLRFSALTIPTGVTIQNAQIEFTVDESGWTDATNLIFHGQCASDAQTFSSSSADISSRTKTSASVQWSSIPIWTTVGAKVQTPNLASIIQEIITTCGYTMDKSMAIIVTGTGHRTAESYDTGSSVAPRLFGTYSLTATPPPPPPSPPLPPPPPPPPPPFSLTLEAENMATKTTGAASGVGWNIWSNGYIEDTVDFPSSDTYAFTVRAYGQYAAGWPNMELRIDGVAVGFATVNSAGYTNYPFSVSITSGSHRVAVAFTNDYYNPPQDRNLIVDKIVISS